MSVETDDYLSCSLFETDNHLSLRKIKIGETIIQYIQNHPEKVFGVFLYNKLVVIVIASGFICPKNFSN